MPAETTMPCPECGGLGQALDCGVLLPTCDECDGTGRVPAVLAYPLAAYIDPEWTGEPDPLPIPKEYRDAR